MFGSPPREPSPTRHLTIFSGSPKIPGANLHSPLFQDQSVSPPGLNLLKNKTQLPLSNFCNIGHKTVANLHFRSNDAMRGGWLAVSEGPDLLVVGMTSKA